MAPSSWSNGEEWSEWSGKPSLVANLLLIAFTVSTCSQIHYPNSKNYKYALMSLRTCCTFSDNAVASLAKSPYLPYVVIGVQSKQTVGLIV